MKERLDERAETEAVMHNAEWQAHKNQKRSLKKYSGFSATGLKIGFPVFSV